MIHDGLWSSFHDHHMGEGTDIVSRELGLERTDQDVWSERSHRRAIEAWDDGRLAEEVVPVEVPQRRGDPVIFDRDEGIRPDTSLESLAALRPAFTADGTVTAGNASQISDGAAAVVVASEEVAKRLELRPIASIEAYGMAAGAYSSLQTVPALAIEAALKRAGLDVGDLGLVEINEAFAAVAIHASRMLGIGDDIVNVNGGAIALGHPIGASGARIVATLLHELARREGRYGLATLCLGGGGSVAMAVELV
jgi:acetyl-CoA C-acetyltransferase